MITLIKNILRVQEYDNFPDRGTFHIIIYNVNISIALSYKMVKWL